MTTYRALLAALVLTTTGIGASSTAASAVTTSPAGAPFAEPEQPTTYLRNVQYVTSSSALDSKTTKTAVAACPAGTVVVGTGADLAWGNGEVFLDHVVPTQTTVTVGASEDETGMDSTWSVTARAVCATKPPGYEIVNSPGKPASTVMRWQSAYCSGHGAAPLGLGWRLADAPDSKGAMGQLTVIEARSLPGSSVTIAASEDDTKVAVSWSLEAIAICADIDGFEVVTETDNSPGTYQVLTSQCPTGKLPIGAGFVVSRPHDVLIDHLYGYSGQDYSYVIAKEDEDGSPVLWTFSVDAMCAPVASLDGPVIP